MQYAPRNIELFEKLLALHRDFLALFPSSEIDLLLYGSVSYAYFTGDANIDVGDLDFMVSEQYFPRIVEGLSADPTVRCELTDSRSVRIWRDGAKLSIHAEEMGYEVADVREDVVLFEMNGVPFKSVSLKNLVKFYQKTVESLPEHEGYVQKLRKLSETK